jgi:DNA-nicking Smr family endonuclease
MIGSGAVLIPNLKNARHDTQFAGTRVPDSFMIGGIFQRFDRNMSSDADDDQAGFMDSLEGIRKLETDKVDLHRQKPRPPARIARRKIDDHAPTTRSRPPHPERRGEAAFFDFGLSKDLRRRIRTGKLDIDDVLDLHGYRQHEARRVLHAFVANAMQNGSRYLLIIHGKGFRSNNESRLRPLTREFLANHPQVLAYCPAIERHGGDGASYAYLRNK